MKVSGSAQGAAAMFAADTASNLLGIEVLQIAPGLADARMRVTSAMLNGHGNCHGGYVFVFADTTFSCACNSHGFVTVAAKADIVFTAPVHLDDVLIAQARERVRYGRHGIYDITVSREGGDVVAEFRGHSHTTRTPLRTDGSPAEPPPGDRAPEA